MFNIQYIAGGLALFFITLAVYNWLSRSASKRASAAKSLAQSKEGQEPTVSLHNPYPNGAPIPQAPKASDEKPQPPPAPPVPSPTPPAQPPSPVPAPAAPPATAAVPSRQPPVSTAATAAPASPEQIYKWN